MRETDFSTLDSGIDIAPGINVAPPIKNFHIRILILFYVNQGIVHFSFFPIFFQKLINLRFSNIIFY